MRSEEFQQEGEQLGSRQDEGLGSWWLVGRGQNSELPDSGRE